MSLRPVSMIARNTSRPMRPNPLIATRTVIFLSFFPEPRERRIGSGLRGDAEMLVQILERRAGAVALHADERAAFAEIALPAHRARSLDGDAHRARYQNRAAIFFRLLVEQFPARYGDDTRSDALRLEQIARLDGDLHLGAGRDQRHARRASRLAQDIGAFGAEILRNVGAHGGEVLPR